MSKHEPKVSKKKYISNMIIAIIIALICGTALGFFTAKFLALRNAEKPPVAQTPSVVEQPIVEPPKTVMPTEVPKLTKDEQTSAVKTILKSYYDINSAVLSKVVSGSLTESKTSGTTQDQAFKDDLYKYFENVAAKDFLNSVKEFIYGGNLKATYYSDFFKTQEGSQVKSVSISEYKDDTIKASVSINTPYKYLSSGVDIIPSATDFFGTDKGKGITQTQYKKLLTLKPTKLTVLQTYNGTITIEKINDKWYITEYSYDLASTEISGVSIKEKTGEKAYTLADFTKKYLSK